MRGKRSGGPRHRAPEPVDIHVGMRVRVRRIELGLTQPEVAAELGINFQQLYKHERAKNRIGVARLYEFRPSLRLRQLRSIEGEMPSSLAICSNGPFDTFPLFSELNKGVHQFGGASSKQITAGGGNCPSCAGADLQ
jgi:transcriptional regulator with XRE-family HTH domain